MVSYVLIITIYLWIFLLIHAYSDSKENMMDALCDCYSVALESISETMSSHEEVNNVEPICYTYSIQKNQQCEYEIISVIFGICNNNEKSDFTQFTLSTLQESIISIHPNEQYIAEPYLSSIKEDDSFLGLKLESIESSTWNEEKQITLCLMNTNSNGITSNNIQFMLETNDIITCENHPNLNGLPCADLKDIEQKPQETISELKQRIQQETVDLDYTQQPTLIPTSHPTLIPTQQSLSPQNRDDRLNEVIQGGLNEESEGIQQKTSSSPPINEIIDNKPETENKIMSQESDHDLTNSKQKGLSVTTRQYIRFAFILIMVFIGLNALCCILLALRQSGALDKYFDDTQEDEMEDETDDDDMDDISETDDDQQQFEDTDDDDDDDDVDIEDSPPVPHSVQNSIADHIKFGDLVAITRSDNNNNNIGDDSNKGAFRIYISQLDNQQNIGSPFKE